MIKRDEYIDYLKGLLIFLVILGHAYYQDTGVFWFIYRFHIPLFLMISGFLFNNKRSFKEFFKSKFKSLIIPYIFFFIISFLMTRFVFGGVSIKKSIMYFIFGGNYLVKVKNRALWYLPIIFIVSIIFYFISKIKNKKIVMFITLLFGVLSVPVYKYLTTAFDREFIPFALNTILPGLFYLGIGYLYKDYKDKKINPIIIIIMFIIGICISIGNESQVLFMDSYIYLIGSLLITPFIILITKGNVNKVFVYLGNNSLYILGIHRLIIELIRHIGFENYLLKLNITKDGTYLLCAIVCTIVTCIIIEIYLFIKNKFKKA